MNIPAETRFHFEEFVLAIAKLQALDGTVELVGFFVCPGCGDQVLDSYWKVGVHLSLRRDGVAGRTEGSGSLAVKGRSAGESLTS